jgi:Transglycosylase SLT domain
MRIMTIATALRGIGARPGRDARRVVASEATRARIGTAGRRPLNVFIAMGVVVALQSVTAGSAAVATLPMEVVATSALKAARAAPAVEPAMSKQPGTFASILDVAFPFPDLVEPVPQLLPELPELPENSTSRAVPLERPDDLVTFGKHTAPRWLVQTILKAAHVAGVDPVYLMTLADVESSLSPEAKAPTSSAEGLFQFIDRTWLETLHAYAADYGFEAAANAITFVNGDPVVTDDKARAWIMSLRRDPYFSALMAGELIKEVQRELRGDGERELEESELYLAHFLGTTNAVRFLRALDEEPNVSAAKLFPEAAKANRGLFTERHGRRRRSISIAEFYERIDSKIMRRLDRYEELTPLPTDPTQTADRTLAASAVLR